MFGDYSYDIETILACAGVPRGGAQAMGWATGRRGAGGGPGWARGWPEGMGSGGDSRLVDRAPDAVRLGADRLGGGDTGWGAAARARLGAVAGGFDGVVRRAALLVGGGCGQGSGLPEGEELVQAGEDAGQGGDDEGVDGAGNPGTRLQRGPRSDAQAGELFAQGGWLTLHAAHTN